MNKGIVTALVFCVALSSLTGCEKRDKGRYYRESKLDVRCESMFNGIVYEMGHTKASIYLIKYELENGSEIELPEYGESCVMLHIEDYDKPVI